MCLGVLGRHREQLTHHHRCHGTLEAGPYHRLQYPDCSGYYHLRPRRIHLSPVILHRLLLRHRHVDREVAGTSSLEYALNVVQLCEEHR